MKGNTNHLLHCAACQSTLNKLNQRQTNYYLLLDYLTTINIRLCVCINTPFPPRGVLVNQRLTFDVTPATFKLFLSSICNIWLVDTDCQQRTRFKLTHSSTSHWYFRVYASFFVQQITFLFPLTSLHGPLNERPLWQLRLCLYRDSHIQSTYLISAANKIHFTQN